MKCNSVIVSYLVSSTGTRTYGRRKTYTSGSSDAVKEEEEKVAAMPYFAYQGFPANDNRVSREGEVPAVSIGTGIFQEC